MQSALVKAWELIRTILFGAIELTVYFPLLVLLHLYVLHAPLWLTVCQLLLCYALGFAAGTALRLTRTISVLLLAASVGLLVSAVFQGWNWNGWSCAVVSLLPVYRGIRFSDTPWSYLFPTSAFLCGFVVYFLGVPIMNHLSAFEPYIAWMNALGMGTLIIFIFYVNRIQLLSATLSDMNKARASLSGTILRLNRLWLTILIAAILAVSFFQQIKEALLGLIRAVMNVLNKWMQSEPLPEGPMMDQQPSLPPPPPPSEPTWFGKLMDYILSTLGYLALLALALYVLYLVLKKLAPVLWSCLQKLLRHQRLLHQHTETERYTDEEEDLLEWKELALGGLRMVVKRLIRKKQELKWSQLSANRDRVRYLYSALIGCAAEKGFRYRQSSTPNETAQELTDRSILPTPIVHEVTSVYNKVRYGEQDISDDEMNHLLKAAGPLLRKSLK